MRWIIATRFRLELRALKVTPVALALVAVMAAVLLVTSKDYPSRSTVHKHALPERGSRPALGSQRYSGQRTVIVMLFDGLAPALVTSTNTPAFNRLRREGSWSDRLIPPFPTVSLVSGFTISTGCWPEHHGIVANRFFDPTRGFYDHSTDADWTAGCEHLHEAAERQGVSTATLDWYGEVSSTHGRLARIVRHSASRKQQPFDLERAQQIVDLLRLPKSERPQLILAYLRGPDTAAHSSGLSSTLTRDAVLTSDGAVSMVLSAIGALGIEQQTTLIVTTDHGMVPVTDMINVQYILRKHDIRGRMVASGTTALVYLEDRLTRDEAVTKLSRYPQFDVIMPERQPS